MDMLDIARRRVRNQLVGNSRFSKPAEVVAWFGAVQAQDFAAARWALGLRMRKASDDGMEDAFNRGEVLRTHVMRPTWHFVAPEDIRWLLALTADRVHAFNGRVYRRSGMDRAIFQRGNVAIEKALRGGNALTRDELQQVLMRAGINTALTGLAYAMMQAELDGVICSGPRRGKQFTYMLLDERVPPAKAIERDEALASLTRRYFSSHGPAQVQDFVWWSGLTSTDARRGLDMNKAHLRSETIEGKTHWFTERSKASTGAPPNVWLAPGFDEYFIAYRDRSAVLRPEYSKHLNLGGGMLNGAVVVDGQMVGGWKRVLQKDGVVVAVRLFEEISRAQEDGIEAAAQGYGKFLKRPITLNVSRA